MKIEDKAYFDGGYFRTAATPLSLFTKDLRETLRRLAAFAECPILGYGKLTTQSEFTSKINQLKTWITADIAKIEKDKLKEKESSNWIRTMDRWIEKRKEVITELKKIEDTKISLLPTVAKNAMSVEDKAYFDRRIYHSTGTFHTLLDKETRVQIDGTSKWVTVDPAQYITPKRVRISGIKGEIEIAAQLSGDEIKGISAKAVKATAARTGTKTKFANRGAFAEASSSPVLGSLLEKKVMPEGGWRAVETDGAALVIAFEDGDIAGNFARRAAENGYSATAPMAMAGRYWNVKVQNENKN